MKTENCIADEFPDDLLLIQQLRLENAVFGEICDDLELLARDLALFPESEGVREQSAYLDVQDSFLALRQELTEFLHRHIISAAGEK